MEKHHEVAIGKVTEYFEKDPEVEALLLGGSLAHGHAKPTSDVDIMIIMSDEAYEKRVSSGATYFMNFDLCQYEGGYVEGKYMDRGLLTKVRDFGSEPSRYAFKDTRVLFSRSSGIEEILRGIARYPVEGKEQRIFRFCAQFEVWFTFVAEALKKGNSYLLSTAVSKMVLFGGRLILAHNELLFPCHKDLPLVLAGASDKPEGLMACIDDLLRDMSLENAARFLTMIRDFRQWVPPGSASWHGQFVADSELNWMDGKTPVDDL